ncbi:MAG: proline racemase family protein [Thermoleophilia bacterium]
MTSSADPAAAGRLVVSTADYHTAGEPFRIVSGGVGPIPGATILAKRRFAAERLDRVRQLLVNEPRGHADMYGCFVTDPVDDGADLGVLFFHNAGYSTACGHGTIALVTWAIESGVVPAVEPETRVTVDAPSGRLETVARVEAGRVRSVRFRNVPSFVRETAIRLDTSVGPLDVDVSFGGAFYGSVPAAQAGLAVEPSVLPRLIALGREVKALLEARGPVEHPLEPELRDVYGVIFHERLAAGPPLVHRNVTIFADGEVDRSPCGSGTSARLALLDASGELARGAALEHRSIVDSVFRGRVVGGAEVAGLPAVLTEVEGSAHPTGHHTFVLDPDDPIGTGFLLR